MKLLLLASLVLPTSFAQTAHADPEIVAPVPTVSAPSATAAPEPAAPPSSAAEVVPAAGLCPTGAFSQIGHQEHMAQTTGLVAANAKTWVESRKCLSCHTTLPMAFMDHHTLDANGQAAAAALHEYIASRADNFLGAQAWYPHVLKQSQGSEAVVSALLVGAHEHGQAASELAKKVFKNLASTQSADGSWEWLAMNLEPFESKRGKLFGNAMAALAYSKAGPEILADPTSVASIANLKTFLRSEAARTDLNNFDKASLLWADAKHPDLLSPETAKKFTSEILASQDQSGGFSSKVTGDWDRTRGGPDLGPDNFATAYVLNAVRESKGFQGSPDFANQWKKGREWLASQRNANGAYPAKSVNRPDNERNNGFITDFANSLSVQVLNAPAP